ncbi:MAG: hypothetical protein O7G88_03850 [bacterium]|nr:hypothetical protein [bacterium]
MAIITAHIAGTTDERSHTDVICAAELLHVCLADDEFLCGTGKWWRYAETLLMWANPDQPPGASPGGAMTSSKEKINADRLSLANAGTRGHA